MGLAESILLLLLEQVGVPFVMRAIAAKTPQEVAHAALDAEYAAIRKLADEEAKRVLG